jgi:hypothetical protein
MITGLEFQSRTLPLLSVFFKNCPLLKYAPEGHVKVGGARGGAMVETLRYKQEAAGSIPDGVIGIH